MRACRRAQQVIDKLNPAWPPPVAADDSGAPLPCARVCTSTTAIGLRKTLPFDLNITLPLLPGHPPPSAPDAAHNLHLCTALPRGQLHLCRRCPSLSGICSYSTLSFRACLASAQYRPQPGHSFKQLSCSLPPARLCCTPFLPASSLRHRLHLPSTDCCSPSALLDPPTDCQLVFAALHRGSVPELAREVPEAD